MRCVVFAYHELGYVCLEELLRLGADVPLVITHEDDPEENVWFRSVAALARNRHLSVFAPQNVNAPEWVNRVEAVRPNFIFSFYYRRLLGRRLLELPTHGALNLHGSLLPRYRGRCPVNWVLIHDEKETGLTLHYMTQKPDAGDIVAQRVIPIDDSDDALSLYRKLAEAAPLLLRDVYPLLCSGNAPRIPQDHSQATYFGGRRPEDGRINWALTARQVFNLVRAVTKPYPGAFAFWRGKKLLVWRASAVPAPAESGLPGTVLETDPELVVQCGRGVVVLEEVQSDREEPCPGAEWARRHGVSRGERMQ
ncbi:MAG: formyltransferase [Candidatus Binatia bacterium]|nr:formyltransferase [Candidatus Binatia bacterium]